MRRILCRIPVKWTCADYDMETEGAYIFTPVIEGYTVSADLPDTSLHYVPFTYAGTVNAYSLDSASSGNVGASAAATASDRSLFVGAYFIC